ncbi:LytTR family transcriptional regulator [Spirosoma sp. HMF3257]|uniref:LytTR family transcriptional regulator n=1 Tax=Spirosoma telluris TaxID=2183553 RepID=A0A327NH50_9BACT|nr:LytTR family transcriptional regulator [Spirosoma telluris]RAI74711.1 LytTR family transcriptional regulator [Spirosoma telluris]
MKRLAAAQLQHNFEPDHVLYLIGDVNYCSLHLLNGKKILSSRTLKWYNDRWPHFIRIHKGSLINPAHVHRCVLVSTISAHLIMRNGARLPIGRRRINGVMEQLGTDVPGDHRSALEAK